MQGPDRGWNYPDALFVGKVGAERECCQDSFWRVVKKNENFTVRSALATPLTVSLTVEYPLFDDFPKAVGRDLDKG